MPRKGDGQDDEETKMIKSALKDGIKEWMDEQFAIFGRWSFYGIAAAGLGALALYLLRANGWNK